MLSVRCGRITLNAYKALNGLLLGLKRPRESIDLCQKPVCNMSSNYAPIRAIFSEQFSIIMYKHTFTQYTFYIFNSLGSITIIVDITLNGSVQYPAF